MSFISNASHFTLGDGVYYNVHGNIVHNHVHNSFLSGRKRRIEEIEDTPVPDLTSTVAKRPRRLEENGIKVELDLKSLTQYGPLMNMLQIIPTKHLKLIREIGRGQGYFLHTGQNRGHAVIVKVFNRGATARKRLESTLALSKGLLHPNILRIEGVSSRISLSHFIAYEDVYWKCAEEPLATALKETLERSIILGFKMVAGLSAGMNHLEISGVSLESMLTKNFDVFLDLDDRFIISINGPPSSRLGTVARVQSQPQDHSWILLDELCQKVLISANRLTHVDYIARSTAEHNPPGSGSSPEYFLIPDHPVETLSPQNSREPSATGVSPRREYLWLSIDREQRSLDSVANQLRMDVDTRSLSLPKSRAVDSSGGTPHRCAGYVREEIMLAPTIACSAVVCLDAPTPCEICVICGEVVSVDEVFDCICGEPQANVRPTLKCSSCGRWSHTDCVGSLKEFFCWRCLSSHSPLPSLGEMSNRELEIPESEPTDTTAQAPLTRSDLDALWSVVESGAELERLLLEEGGLSPDQIKHLEDTRLALGRALQARDLEEDTLG
ncbi:hypothetical protein C8J57DRAFT_1730489 [Mycena rebaudengoi]|nr:hypothetical protein C8J57DRAFT_1730489 [Mycena rebaudengoi]